MENKESAVQEEKTLSWPNQPAGLLIMGKRQGTKKENHQPPNPS